MMALSWHQVSPSCPSAPGHLRPLLLKDSATCALHVARTAPQSIPSWACSKFTPPALSHQLHERALLPMPQPLLSHTCFPSLPLLCVCLSQSWSVLINHTYNNPVPMRELHDAYALARQCVQAV